jgi:hypothetical protein
MRLLLGSFLLWLLEPALTRQRRLDHRPAPDRAPRFAVATDGGKAAFISAEAMGVHPRDAA